MNGDLISRSALVEYCQRLAIDEWNNKTAPTSWAYAYGEFADMVEAAPAVDAVEVVRCKDCKRRGDPDKCPMCYEVPVYQCNGEDSDGELCWDVWEEIEDRTIDDSFCSCGERRADNG